MEDEEEPGAWSVCLPTADETTVSLCCPLEPGSPWLAGRALDIFRQSGGVEPDPSRQRYVTGTRRDAPLILGEPLLWRGMPATLEACQVDDGGTGEVTVRLPPWSELAQVVAERELWQLTDSLAEEFSARCGVVSDGARVGYPDLSRPRAWGPKLQREHLGVIVSPAWMGFLRRGSGVYLELPRCELLVVLE